jgi:RsmE family RNA methyltransferase
VNLLLLDADECRPGGEVRLADRRARHLREVLRVAPGSEVRVGRIDGPLGRGTVLHSDARGVTLRCEFEPEPPPAGADVLLLAVPRPKVLARCLELAAALGYARVVLLRSWRVDKAHLGSRELDPARLRASCLRGLEQARRTRVPAVATFPRFKPFDEDVLDGLVPRAARVVAHPGAATPTAGAPVAAAAPFTLALGPEGGWLPYEVDLLAARGFVPVHAGPHPLRVESALALLHGQLALLRQLAEEGRTPLGEVASRGR